MSARAKAFIFPDLNFQCTTPDDWNTDHKIGDVVHAVNGTKSKYFCLKVYKCPLTRHQLQDAEHAMMAILSGQGYTGSPRALLTLRGVSFDTFAFSQSSENQTYQLSEIIGRFQGFIYQFELASTDGTPYRDPELKSIVDSFDFINRKGVPSTDGTDQSNSDDSTPAPPGKVD